MKSYDPTAVFLKILAFDPTAVKKCHFLESK